MRSGEFRAYRYLLLKPSGCPSSSRRPKKGLRSWMPSESPSISRRRTADPLAGGLLRAAFHLDGPTRALDARVNAFRGDIADIALAGTLFAPHYASPLARVATSTTMIRTVPGHHAEASSQLLPGEGFAVLDLSGGWAWGQIGEDGLVGYVPAAALHPVQ